MIRAYIVKVVTPIIAPYTIPARYVVPPDKYDPKVVDHIDACFHRIAPFDGSSNVLLPTILGNTVKGAINRHFIQQGVEPPTEIRNMKVLGMQCPEERVVLYQYNIVTKKGKQSLVNKEMILANTTCIAYIDDAIEKHLPLEIVIGPKRNQGYGRAVILAQTGKPATPTPAIQKVRAYTNIVPPPGRR